MRFLRAHYTATLGFNRFGIQSKGPQWGNSAPTMCSLCAHYAVKPLWCSIYGPTVGPLCAYYAPTMSPPWASTALGFNRRAPGGATLRPLCARDVPTMSSSRFGLQFDRPQSGHYVPTMRPLCAHLGFQPFWGSIEGPTVGPLCAYDAAIMRPLCH